MKIYIGKNKKLAKEVNLRYLMNLMIGADFDELGGRIEVSTYDVDDDSYATLDFRVPFKNKTESGVYDIVLNFSPKNLNEVNDINIYKSLWVLDEQNMKKLT